MAAVWAVTAWAQPTVGIAAPQGPAGEPSTPASPPAGVLSGRPTLTATRATMAPRIDGRLDDPMWETAARIDDFVQTEPVEGQPATESTEVLVTYDSQRIYIGVRAEYSEPAAIRANRVERDSIWSDDRVSVIFDPFLDQQRAYRFSINGYGVQGDSIVGTNGGIGDTSWDALFESVGAIGKHGWTAEVAIPFKSLRYPARRGVHRWGFQVERTIVGKDETAVWSPVSRDVLNKLTQMGVLEGMSGLSASRNIELLPTFASVRVDQLDTGTGGYVAESQTVGGISVKYGATSNLTFDATFNPDFSQIESDRQQIEVNQRFPVRYPELRPFFLEGQEIFDIPGPITFIHTRTIVDPQIGAKLTGKIGNTAVGLVVANDEAPGRTEDPGDPAFGRTATFILARVRYDLFPESTASLVFTDREFLDQFSRATGFDGDFALGRTHRAFARVIFTDHRDAIGIRRKGHFYDVNFRKAGRNLGYSIVSNAISPDLRTDAGFVRRTDQRQTSANLSYRWWPERRLVTWSPRISYSRNYQFDGTLQEEDISGRVSFTFARNVTFDATANRDMERFQNIDFWKTHFAVGGRVASSRRAEVRAGFNRGDQIRFVANPFLGTQTGWDIAMTVRPSARLQSDVSLDYSRLDDPLTGENVFDIKILRALTTYQFTDRLLIRNILEHNTFEKTLGINLLLTYRVNAGTVFFVGYDHGYQEAGRIDGQTPLTGLTRTQRAVFTKLQYLFRL